MTKRRSSAEPSSHPSKRTNLGKSVLQDVTEAIHNAIARIDSGDVDEEEILRHSEAILDDLQDLSAAIYTTRATALGKNGQFDQALEEASKAMKCKPSSPQGYLVASDLYGAQGHVKSAKQVLEVGLRSVLPSDWPSLYDKREEVQHSMQTGVDFTSKLPSEVISRIWVYVSGKREDGHLYDIITCTAVSRSWRASVLQCSEAWELADVGTDCSWFAPIPLFQSIGTFIKDLRVCYLDDRQMGVKLVELASSGIFPSVRILSIVNFSCPSYEAEMYTTLITLLGKQLTELEIDIHTNFDEEVVPKLPLELILTVCPNLKRFDFRSEEPVLTLAPSTSRSRPLNLEVIQCHDGIRDSLILEWLIPLCPRLQRLVVSCFPFKLLPLIHKHCRSLKDLVVASGYAHGGAQEPTDNAQASLQRIACSFKEGDASQLIQNLKPFFTKNKDTLETVDLKVEGLISASVHRHWNSIANVQYSRLTNLDLRFEKDASRDIGRSVPKLLRKCPKLERLYLKIDGQVQDDFFAPLIDMPHLRDLAVFNFQSCGGLDRFFKHHSSLGHRSPLQVLGVNYCTGVTNMILHTIAEITTLHIIHFRGHFPSTTYCGMDEFFQKVGMNVNLRILMMHNVMHLRLDSGKKLASISNMTWKMYRKGSEEYSVELLRKR